MKRKPNFLRGNISLKDGSLPYVGGESGLFGFANGFLYYKLTYLHCLHSHFHSCAL